jgi:hypothetical protein
VMRIGKLRVVFVCCLLLVACRGKGRLVETLPDVADACDIPYRQADILAGEGAVGPVDVVLPHDPLSLDLMDEAWDLAEFGTDVTDVLETVQDNFEALDSGPDPVDVVDAFVDMVETFDSSEDMAETHDTSDICTPDCDGMECGSDGCDGSCGECPSIPCFDLCVEGTCEASAIGPEECDGLDNNCDGLVDEGYPDTDGDGEADCVETGPCYFIPGEGWDSDCDGYGDLVDCDPTDGQIFPEAAELCDEVDNNCNGIVDENCPCIPKCEGKECGDDGCDGSCGECDDGDPNTAGYCGWQTGQCAFSSPQCNDDSFCSDDYEDPDTGECLFVAIECDDEDLCTVDSCIPAIGCKHILGPDCALVGPCEDCVYHEECGCCHGVKKDCDDSNPCTTGDYCDSELGACVNNWKNCDDGNKCTVDTCDQETGNCQSELKDCDDGSSCTTDYCYGETGKCVNEKIPCDCPSCHACDCDPETGECHSAPVDCDDGNLCTDDVCLPAVGCKNEPKNCFPDDPDPCVSYNCSADTGQCYQELKDCDDGDECTSGDYCDPALGGCVNLLVSCDDDDPCTEDSCDSGEGCLNAALCADDDPCTMDFCDPDSGCIELPLCYDDDPCTEDICEPGVGCTNTSKCDCGTCEYCDCSEDWPFAKCIPDCDDENVCTMDSCNDDGECEYADVDCSDGTKCTLDFCNPQGGCHYVLKFDTSSVCLGWVCNEEVGLPIWFPACSDGNACTMDFCNEADEGSCSYELVDCDDNNLCTGDSCDPDVGCTLLPKDCDDGNSDTVDLCDPATGQCFGCLPDCLGKECGDDGCGGSCGVCPQGLTCPSGQCLSGIDIWVDESNSWDVAQDGSEEHPFGTIQQGAAAAQPGAIVHILAGDYVGEVELGTPYVHLAGSSMDEVSLGCSSGETCITVSASGISVSRIFVVGGHFGIRVLGEENQPLLDFALELVSVSVAHFGYNKPYPPVPPCSDLCGAVGVDLRHVKRAYLSQVTVADVYSYELLWPAEETAGIGVLDCVDVVLQDCSVTDIRGGWGTCGKSPLASGITVVESESCSLQNLAIEKVQGGYSDCADAGDGVGIRLVECKGCTVSETAVHDVSGGASAFDNCGDAYGIWAEHGTNLAILDCSIAEILGGWDNWDQPDGAGASTGISIGDSTGVQIAGCSVQAVDAAASWGVPAGDASATGVAIGDSGPVSLERSLIWDVEAGCDGLNAALATGLLLDNVVGIEVSSLTIANVRGACDDWEEPPKPPPFHMGVGIRVSGAQPETVEVMNTVVHQTTDSCATNDPGNDSSLLQLRYCNLDACGQTTSSNSEVGGTCAFEDPLFLDSEAGDYSLSPNSPCIDAGDPQVAYSSEPEPNGCQVNMGAYGNTAKAASAKDAAHCANE